MQHSDGLQRGACSRAPMFHSSTKALFYSSLQLFCKLFGPFSVNLILMFIFPLPTFFRPVSPEPRFIDGWTASVGCNQIPCSGQACRRVITCRHSHLPMTRNFLSIFSHRALSGLPKRSHFATSRKWRKDQDRSGAARSICVLWPRTLPLI